MHRHETTEIELMGKLSFPEGGLSVTEPPARPTRIRTIHFVRSSVLKEAAPAVLLGILDGLDGPDTTASESERSLQAGTMPAASELYVEIFQYMTRTFADLKAGRRIDLSDGRSIANRVVSHLASGSGLLRLALDRTTPSSIQLHSVNVSIIAAKIAQTLHWTDERIQRVALAGLMHDLGAARSPSLIFKSPSSADPDRLEMPLQSAELLSGQPEFEWLRRIVAQAHEREDGSGYPMGLRTRDICDEAKVLGVADVFEICLRQNAQRAGLTGYAAMQIITSDEHGFTEQIRKAVIQSFSVYPYNEYVELNTGEVAVVTDINPENALRPVVRVLYSVDRNPVSEPRSIDLTKYSQVWIRAALTAADLPRKA